MTPHGRRGYISEIEKCLCRQARRKKSWFTRNLEAILYATSSAANPPMHKCVRVRVRVASPRSFERKSFLPPCQSKGPQDGNYGTPLHAARQLDRYFHVGEKYVTNPTLTSSGFRSRSLVQRYISYISHGASWVSGPSSRTLLSNLIPHSSVRPPKLMSHAP